MKKLLALNSLTRDESVDLFSKLESLPIEQQSAILSLLRAKKETEDEILGAIDYFQNYSSFIDYDDNVVDIVGTGGDCTGTFNISTAASIVAASCGCPIVKHGNRSSTSKSGSQDVVSALKIRTFAGHHDALNALQKYNYTYLLASNFNSRLGLFGELRRKLGFATIFNIIGPLLNPIRPKYQVVGVYRKDLIEKTIRVLKSQGLKRAMVVHSDEGLDELSVSSHSYVAELRDGVIKQYIFYPGALGIPCSPLAEIIGGTPEENAKIICDVFSGEVKGAKLDVIALNAAAGLYVGGFFSNIRDAFFAAKEAVENGNALLLLNKLRGKYE